MTDLDLELSLTELAERVEIPGGAWLVDDVMRRIAEPAPPRRHPRRAVRIAGALVLALVVVAVVLPGPRHAVARWLGFDSVRIEPGVTVPTTASPSSSTPSVVATTSVPEPALELGEDVSIEDAIARTGLPDPTPALLGAPLSVHVVEPPKSGQIVLVYTPSELVPESSVTGAGAIVSVMPAKIEEGFFRKTLGNAATVRPVSVDGARGYWIEGSPHELMFEFGDEVLPDAFRLATNTLLWQRGDHVYRIEADIDLGAAVRIAKSVP
jgi:hypothetical protein